MVAELTDEQKEAALLAAMQASVDEQQAAREAVNRRTRPDALPVEGSVFDQARQAYTQHNQSGYTPLENQVVNPKLLEPLPPDTMSVSNATMPQPSASMANPAGGYVIPERSYVRAELPEESFDAFGGDAPIAVLAPEAPAALRYLPADAPQVGSSPNSPPVAPTLQQEAPLQASGIGAPQVKMDPRYAEGITERQNTLRDLQALLKEGEAPIKTKEDEYTTRMGQYATDLGTLQKKRGELDTARGVERQIESADMARTAMRFDANRVFSDVASSPLGTAGLAIASGIVQGLNGYAGQDKPDAILSAIKDAATRDVGNQVKMSEAGEKSRLGSKNAYDEAIKSGADKQEAVRLAAMASLDQIGKGLDFMKARQVRAKDRADLEIASGALKSEAGKEFTKMAMDNAAMRLQASIATLSNSTHLQVANATARREYMHMSAAAREKATAAVGAYMMDPEKGGAILKNVSNAQEFYSELKKGIASGEKLEDLVAKDWITTLSQKLTEASSVTGTDKSVVQATFDAQAALAMKSGWSQEKKAVMSIVSAMYSDRLREQLGRSQTKPELAAQAIVTDLKDPDSVMRFVRKTLNDASLTYQNQVSMAREHKPVWDAALGNQIQLAYALEKDMFSGGKSATVVKQ